MQEVFSLAFEPSSAIRHHAPALGCADFAAEIGLFITTVSVLDTTRKKREKKRVRLNLARCTKLAISALRTNYLSGGGQIPLLCAE